MLLDTCANTKWNTRTTLTGDPGFLESCSFSFQPCLEWSSQNMMDPFSLLYWKDRAGPGLKNNRYTRLFGRLSLISRSWLSFSLVFSYVCRLNICMNPFISSPWRLFWWIMSHYHFNNGIKKSRLAFIHRNEKPWITLFYEKSTRFYKNHSSLLPGPCMDVDNRIYFSSG